MSPDLSKRQWSCWPSSALGCRDFRAAGRAVAALLSGPSCQAGLAASGCGPVAACPGQPCRACRAAVAHEPTRSARLASLQIRPAPRAGAGQRAVRRKGGVHVPHRTRLQVRMRRVPGGCLAEAAGARLQGRARAGLQPVSTPPTRGLPPGAQRGAACPARRPTCPCRYGAPHAAARQTSRRSPSRWRLWRGSPGPTACSKCPQRCAPGTARPWLPACTHAWDPCTACLPGWPGAPRGSRC